MTMDEKTQLTDAEWRARLTPEQYAVLREKGTERAFTGAYTDTKTPGVYRCAGCGTELFRSDAKFDSGSGWPSFVEPASLESVDTHVDTELRDDPHRGHVRRLRRPPRPRLPGRPRPDRPALLHQLLRARARAATVTTPARRAGRVRRLRRARVLVFVRCWSGASSGAPRIGQGARTCCSPAITDKNGVGSVGLLGGGSDGHARRTIDERKLEAFMGQIVLDMGAAISAPLVIIGDEARSLPGDGRRRRPVDVGRGLGERAGCLRALRARVAPQPGGRRVRRVRRRVGSVHAAATSRLRPSPTRSSPFFVCGAFQLISSIYAGRAAPRRVHAHRRGVMGWHEHDHRPVRGDGALLPPRLQGESHERLDPGARRGRRRSSSGAPSLPTSAAVTGPRRSSWPEAYPALPIRRVRLPRRLDRTRLARRHVEAGVADRVTFEVATREGLRRHAVTTSRAYFDSLHDMGDPVGAARHVLETLARRTAPG